MPRPATIRDEQILEAARAVFLKRGIRATTAEVAKRAGIAEGSIFRRFPTKASLWRAAMQPQMDNPEFIQMLERRVGQGDLRRNLREAGAEALELFSRVMPVMMMGWSNRDGEGEHPLDHLSRVADPPPLKALRRVAAVFREEIRLGRLRKQNPEVLARIYVGSMQNYVFFALLMRSHGVQVIPKDQYLRDVVDLLWRGAAPEDER